MPAAWRVAVENLVDGKQTPQKTVAHVNASYKTPCARRSMMSRVKRHYSKSPKAKKEVASLLRPAREDTKACAAHQRKAQGQKMKRALRFDNVALVDHAKSVLADEESGLYELALALMTVTGRRTAEILNGRSKLVPVKAKSARFHGQLKKRKGMSSAYDIPLLCDASMVRDAFRRLRDLQPKDIASYENARVSRRYQSGLRQHARKHPVYGKLNRLHDLRGCYAVMCLHLYDMGDASDLYAISKLLGEADHNVATVYSAYKMSHPASWKQGMFGRWKVD